MATLISKKNEKELINLIEGEFGKKMPTKKQMEKFVIERSSPRNDGGISIAIAAAALLLQLYSEFKTDRERKRNRQQTTNPPPPTCPKKDCGLPAIGKLNNGQLICKNGHKWKPK